jgi:DNA replication protein DnaC
LESDGEWAKSAKCIFILDDLGREKDTEATAGRLASMIAARYERRATTIITSNLSLEAIGAKYGRDIQSRLLDRRWITIVPIRAEDARLRAPNVQSEKRLTVCA